MKRYASVDFLRGLAIFLMIFVHTMERWVDRVPIMADMGSYSLFAIIFFIAVLFMGAWCGLFLMVSATGNMISMHKSYERNPKVRTTVIKQIIGGFILLLAAMITETLSGYGGYLGHLAIGRPDTWPGIFNNFYHFETIHAVAWCIILNGVTQGILSIKGGWKKINRNIVIYIILAILVVVVTPTVWNLVSNFEGYPYGTRSFTWDIFGQSFDITNSKVQMGFLGYDSFGRLAILFFLNPLAAPVEPVFPFLAVSYIGSIIGLFLIRKQKEMDGYGKEEGEYDVSPMKKPKMWVKRLFRFLWFTSLVSFITFAMLWQYSVTGDHFRFMQIMIGSLMSFSLISIVLFYFRRREKETSAYKRHTLGAKIGILVGFILFVVGLAGVFLVVFTSPSEVLDNLLGQTYNVRGLFEHRTWLWWFSVITGAQISAFFLLIRAIEFRGKASKFGRKTLWMRRFGFVPFSIYNYQFIDVVPALLLGVISPFITITDPWSTNGFIFQEFGLHTYGVYGIWFLLGLLLLIYWLVLWIWQKLRFVGGWEWFLKGISSIFFPSKRKGRIFGGLNVEQGLVNPDWIEIVAEKDIPRQELVDSKLSFKLSWMGLLIAPISLVTLGISITALKKEGKNKYSISALIISILGALLAAGILIGTMFIYGISF